MFFVAGAFVSKHSNYEIINLACSSQEIDILS